MVEILVHMAEMRFSTDTREVLCALSLGCGICISLYDPRIKAGGLVVSALPDAGLAGGVAPTDHPFAFIDQAVPRMLENAMENGLQPETSKIVLAGGGWIPGQTGIYDIGRQNGRKAMKMLGDYGLKPVHFSLGRGMNRSLFLEIKTGAVRITSAGRETADL